MKDILNFLIEIGRLKGRERRGWLIHRIPGKKETTAEHIFRTAILAWILGAEKKNLNLGRVIKIALVHDLCEVYTIDLTPYDPLLPKNKKKIAEVLKHWPKFTPELKLKRHNGKHKAELKSLNKLISKLPRNLKIEIKNLWLDFENGLTKEGRFVKQADKMENFLQGLEYYKKYGRIQHRLWMRWVKEIIDDPVLIGLMRNIENKFCRGHRHN